MEAIGMFPNQPKSQAGYLIEQSRLRFGDYWSSVVVNEEGGFAMSAVVGKHKNTSCELRIGGLTYWIGRTSADQQASLKERWR